MNDSHDGYVLLFEATAWATNARGQTWTFENATWQNVTNSSDAPPDLVYPGFAYDPLDGEAVLFGGTYSNAGTPESWTWAFSSGSWQNLTAAVGSAPSTRSSPALAFDSARSEVLLFGGLDSVGTPLNDTWAFRGGTWSNLSGGLARAPPPRLGAALAYDLGDRAMVLFGGVVPGVLAPLNDTWTFQNGMWTAVNPRGGGPPPLQDPAAVSLPGSGSVLVIGCQYPRPHLWEGWVFAHGNWSASDAGGLPSGNYGCSNSIAPMNGSQSAVLLTPLALGTCGGPTWVLNGSTWQSVEVAGSPGPCPSYSAQAIYDAGDEYVVVFGGGLSGACCPTNDTWIYRNTTWTNVTSEEKTAPNPRFYEGFVYDATDGYGVLFGGESDPGCTWHSGLSYCSDTWAFADGAWTNLTYLSASHPSARAGAGFAYDAADGVVVLFGGYGPTSTYADTWSFHGGVWTDLTTKVSGAPAARWVPEMAYDWQEGYVLMFGGRNANDSESLGDTWSYSSESWSLLTPVHSPPPTDEGAMSFDSSLGIEILVGGWDVPWDASLIPLTQVWGFNGTDWAVVPTTPSPYLWCSRTSGRLNCQDIWPAPGRGGRGQGRCPVPSTSRQAAPGTGCSLRRDTQALRGLRANAEAMVSPVSRGGGRGTP